MHAIILSLLYVPLFPMANNKEEAKPTTNPFPITPIMRRKVCLDNTQEKIADETPSVAKIPKPITTKVTSTSGPLTIK